MLQLFAAGMERDHPLIVVQVGQGLSHSRDSIQEELRAAYDVEHARWEEGDDDDDETQPPYAGSYSYNVDYPYSRVIHVAIF